MRGGQNLPACYVTNIAPVLEARFTVVPDRVTSCTLFATGGPFGGIQATNVAFAHGDSGFVRLAASGRTGTTLDRTKFNFAWKTTALNDDAFAAYNFQNSNNHILYTIFREPLSPWTNAWPHVQNAWTNALEFAIVKTNAKGASTVTNALAKVTQYLFSGHGLVYDTTNGVSSYTTKMAGYFNASGYMNKSATSDIYGNGRNGNIVNCYDQAAALTCFGRLLGVGVQYRLQAPFGCLNPIHVVGPIYTNNPFFDSVGTLPLVGLDEARTRFGNHAFSTFNEMVFDACAGPAKGSQSVGGYLADTIDRSTNWELRIAAPPTAIPVTNTFSRIF